MIHFNLLNIETKLAPLLLIRTFVGTSVIRAAQQSIMSRQDPFNMRVFIMVTLAVLHSAHRATSRS